MSEREERCALLSRLPAEEQQEIFAGLWELLKWQAGKYTGGDSSSMSAGRARELLGSLLYTLSVVSENDGVPPEKLLRSDLKSVVRRGQDILAHKRSEVKELWSSVCLSAPRTENAYYTATLKSIGRFFGSYEVIYDAHQIPCDIDYPLLCPVPETVPGISYVEEYLRRAGIENRFMNCFPAENVKGLLSSAVPGYWDLMVNLCEPVLANAAGRAMLGLDVRPLDISPEQRSVLARRLSGRTAEELRALFDAAVSYACVSLGFPDGAVSEYLREVAHGLAVRVSEAAKHGEMQHVFFSVNRAFYGGE